MLLQKHLGDSMVDAFLHRFSVYVAPLTIAVFSFIALISWDTQYSDGSAHQLEFRYLEQTGSTLNPVEALEQLNEAPKVRAHDTRLAESPFWFSFVAQPVDTDGGSIVELPSRHAVETSCWGGSGLNFIGSANRKFSQGRINVAKAGFRIEMEPASEEQTILCRASYEGPARISVLQWPTQQFAASTLRFHRDSGLLDGGLLVLSIFVLLTAVINREWMYVLFAAWLVSNLRMAALSAGWDTQWLGRAIPADWVIPTRKLTMTSYYILTIALFSKLFGDDLKRVGYAWLLRIAQWSGIPLLAMAALLSYPQFLPCLWLATAFSIGVVGFLLTRILLVTRARVAIWYAASLGTTLFASFYEVISAALGFKDLISAVNSVTAALASSLMAALAIAEQMRQDRQARINAQAELRGTYDAIPIGLFTLGTDGTFLRSNPALDQMLNAGPDRARHWGDFFEADAWAWLQNAVRSKAGDEFEIRSAEKIGETQKCFLVKATLAQDKIEGSIQDVTERTKATERLLFLAEYDPLTNVLNRRGIEKILVAAIGEVADGKPLAIAYLDLDRFKLINDLFGHLTGDEVLKQVCLRIKEMLSPGHEVGRVGGDEFVIVLRQTPIAMARDACRAIVDRIGTQPYRIGDKAFQVKGSIGLIEVSTGTMVKDAISVADRACREAKNGHHNNLVVYEKTATAFREREDELRLISRFGVGAVPEGLFLEMQPIMSLRTPYESLNFEVLLRLREVDNSITPAGKIIPAAENNGRISAIDRWVLSTTLEWLDTYHRGLKKTRFVCLNLSGASLNDEKFIQDAFAMVAQYGRVAEMLCFEITESVALHDLANTRRFIDRVRGFGAKVALDDFGAGYTSFSYLKELPADAIKIDGAFVRDVNAHPANLAIVEAIAELARNLGMKSIAEWAEDCATIESLAQVGVDYVQGYAISRPTNPARILGANSSASLIENEEVAAYVRDVLQKGQVLESWSQSDSLTAARRH